MFPVIIILVICTVVIVVDIVLVIDNIVALIILLFAVAFATVDVVLFPSTSTLSTTTPSPVLQICLPQMIRMPVTMT
jgi:hypothetical protein